jgi:hypothetical protein
MCRPCSFWLLTAISVLEGIGVVHAGGKDDAALRADAANGLDRSIQFFRKQVATEGGYLWRYSADLNQREGEGKATATQVWVQPPGTPAVGMALLKAYEATGDKEHLAAAVETARCLVRGQLRSGGWDYSIEFDPKRRRLWNYRADGKNPKGKNVSTLDDNTTQAALRFLMRVDVALGHKDREIHDAALYGLNALLHAQYPNGAWPQRFEAPPEPGKFPVKQASYPDAWPKKWPGADYRGYYTFNDNSIADVIDTLFEASRLYAPLAPLGRGVGGEGQYDPKTGATVNDSKESVAAGRPLTPGPSPQEGEGSQALAARCRAAAAKAGDFMLLAQMPEPQPGWAQQYDLNMQPAWARKFEPPAITGGESQGVMLTLLKIYRATGDKKYLEPLPRALAYYRRSVLSDGRLARFYELKTNKPLHFTKKYELTYDDSDVPTHYGFKVGSRLDAIAKEYERLRQLGPADLKHPAQASAPKATDALRNQVSAVLAALDERGAWVTPGKMRSQGADAATEKVIESQTFIRNLGVLSDYLAATRK